MRSMYVLGVSAMTALTVGLVACGGGGGGGDVSYDPDQTMQALQDKVGVNGTPAELKTGVPPAPNSQDVKTDAPNADVSAVVGTRVTIPVSITAAAALERLYAKIPGAPSYFEVTLVGAKSNGLSKRRLTPVLAKSSGDTATGKGTTVVNFQVDVPADLEPGGRLCFELSAQANAQISDPDLACLSIRAATPQPTASPTPTPTPPVGDNTAAACLNPALFAVGANVTQIYREVVDGETFSYDDSYTIAREVTFNGNTASELAYSDGSLEYLRAEPSNQRVLIFGSASDGITTTFNPPFEFPLGLSAGQSRTQTITVTVAGSGLNETVTVTNTFTYSGRERISVPAGSFDSCKFSETSTYPTGWDGGDFGFALDADIWFAVGNGLTVRDDVRDEFGSFLSELQNASINGQTVTGN